MYKRICFVLFLVVLVGSFADAQEYGAITGRVVGIHGPDMTPLEGAYVRATAIGGSGVYADYTNAYGVYDMPAVQIGWYLMVASKPGYQNSYAIVRVRLGEYARQNFALVPVDKIECTRQL